MTPRQCEIAAESHAASLLAQAGYDVLVQYGGSQPEYDLVAVKGKRVVLVSVKGSQDGRWTLPVRYKDRGISYDEAIDHWLAAQKDDVVLLLVQFDGTVLGSTPDVYVARPIEVAIHLKTQRHGLGDESFQEDLRKRHRIPQYVDLVPPEWVFSQERIDAI